MSGSLSPWPVVATGHNGHPVKTLQFLLRARGHTVTVDGIFGPQTDAAMKAFQMSKGLAADGTADPNTWTALIIQVKKGNSGDAVRGVQEEFQFRNESGDPNKGVQVDGIFGLDGNDRLQGVENIQFPEPVISVAIEPKTKVDLDKMGIALQRLSEEDPTFRVHTDEETGQNIIAGMGELHLEIIIDRLKRERP